MHATPTARRVKRNRGEQTAAERQTRLSSNRQSTACTRQVDSRTVPGKVVSQQTRHSTRKTGRDSRTVSDKVVSQQTRHSTRKTRSAPSKVVSQKDKAQHAQDRQTQEQCQARLERQQQSTHPSRPLQERMTKVGLNYNSSYNYSCHPDVPSRKSVNTAMPVVKLLECAAQMERSSCFPFMELLSL